MTWQRSQPLLNDHREANTQAAEQLRSLLKYTTYEKPGRPGRYADWLTHYAVGYRYSGTGFRMEDLDRERFRDEINLSVNAFIGRAQELTGTGASDLE